MTRIRSEQWLILLILLGGFAVRVIGLHDTSLWLDELQQMHMAGRPFAELMELLYNHVNLPVDYLISKSLLMLGKQEGWLRLAPALAGTLSLPLVYAVARRLAPGPLPILSMALLALSPLAVQHSREMRPYSMLVMLTLFSVLFFLAALKQPRYWIGFVVAMLLTLHTHLFAIAILPMFVLYTLIWCVGPFLVRERRWSLLLPPVMVGLVILLYLLSPFIPDYVGRIGAAVVAGLGQTEAPQLDSSARVAYPFPGWIPLAKRLPYDFTGRIGEISLNGALSILGVALAVLGAVSLRRRPRALSLLLMWLVLSPAVIIITLSQRDHWFSPRYIIQALPAWLILVGAGLAALGGLIDRWVGRRILVGVNTAIPIGVIVVTATYLILVIPSLAAIHDDPHENIRGAAAYIDQHYQPGDLVVAPVAGRFLHHYLPPEIPVLDTDDSAIAELTGRGYERVFVMQSQYSPFQEADAPWITPKNLLATFDPGIAVYNGPAGETARTYLLQRLVDSTGDAISEENLRQLAFEARKLNDWEMAIAVLETLLGKHPDDTDLWTELGFAQNMHGDYDQAINAYDQAIVLSPNHVWAHILAANSYRLKGDMTKGLSFAQKAVELDPMQGAAWTALGNIQLSLDQPGNAADSFSQGVALQNDNLDARAGYARAATALNLPDAPAAWLEVLSLSPPDAIITEACQYLTADAHPACSQ